MVDAHAHLDIDQFLVRKNVEGRDQSPRIGNRDRVGHGHGHARVQSESQLHEGRDPELHDGGGARIENANVIAPGEQRPGLIRQPQGQICARRIDYGGLVILIGRRSRLPPDQHLQGAGHLRKSHDQIRRLGGHIAEEAVLFVRTDGGRDPARTRGPQIAIERRLQADGQSLDPSRVGHGVVHHVQHPNAGSLRSNKIVQSAGPIGVTAEGERPERLIVVEKEVGPGKEAAVQAMVVQHHFRLIMAQNSNQIAHVLVGDDVGHRRALNDGGGQADRKNLHSARIAGRAVRNDGPGRKAVEHASSVVILLEGLVAGKRDQSVFAGLLILRFDADVKHVAERGVGQDHKLRAAPPDGFERGVDRARLQIGQGRVFRDEKIDVGFEVAGYPDVGRDEGDEGDVGSVGQGGEGVGQVSIGKGEEIPLTDRAVPGAKESGLRSDPLFEQGDSIGHGGDHGR